MSRSLIALAGLLFLSACGGGGYDTPPRNLDNACSIVSQRPSYLREMKKIERKWGVPVHVQMATIHQESKFDGDARTPVQWKLGLIPMGRQSSAFGYSQALDGTWDEYVKTEGRRGAKRDNFADAVDFMGWYMDQTYRELGISKHNAKHQYLAYHEGRTGYRRGSYKSKGWLVNVSDKVATRASMYEAQLWTCA